jgi:PKD domain-containing protein
MRRVRSSRPLPDLLLDVVGVLATVVAVVASIAAVVAGSASATVASSSNAPAVPARGLLFGAAAYHPDDGTGITALESSLGRTLAIARVFAQWDTAEPASSVVSNAAAGRMNLLSVVPQLGNGTKISWARVASGAEDGQIRRQIIGLRSFGHPVMLAFQHEADLSSGYGTSSQFRAAFRHYVAVARATGETNISFVVILAAATYGSAISSWYPGDDVVDWAGADSYNFGSCSPGRPPWRSFATATENFRTWGEAHHKPQVLAEWGSAEDPHVPGRKAQWIADAGVVMQHWSHLRAASYFDEPGSCNWQLNTSTSSATAYRTLARSPEANGGSTAALVVSGLSPARTVVFSAAGSTGSDHATGTGVTRWSFAAGDASGVRQGSGQPSTITHQYAHSGTYSATLTVRDAAGRLSTTHRSVRVG